MSDSIPPDYQEQINRLSSDCIRLCDEFNKFSEECAFICDAFAAVTRDPDDISPDTSEGIGHISYWLKYQVKDYREKIDELHQGLSSLRRQT
ncbi:hypothetical protein SG34_010895 [Thalassomonas viridans]|uniref:Uncharacterized protein n=1 Tax=Thalassomonas viridans TaxID=137584 RepID=A0AAE9Z674_9GAMM|nr:hypothetical protein [Thalassomonas viridans]WDE07338.1 hypothetical protein SG34_010895 [Thalassomonas viridans]